MRGSLKMTETLAENDRSAATRRVLSRPHAFDGSEPPYAYEGSQETRLPAAGRPLRQALRKDT